MKRLPFVNLKILAVILCWFSKTVRGVEELDFQCEDGHNCEKIMRPKLEYYSPSTEGWKAINDRRFKQIASSASPVDDKFSFYTVRDAKMRFVTITLLFTIFLVSTNA